MQQITAGFEEAIKPVSFGEASALMYKSWVKLMYDKVVKLSHGKVGYVHMQSMNNGTYRTVVDEVMGP